MYVGKPEGDKKKGKKGNDGNGNQGMGPNQKESLFGMGNMGMCDDVGEGKKDDGMTREARIQTLEHTHTHTHAQIQIHADNTQEMGENVRPLFFCSFNAKSFRTSARPRQMKEKEKGSSPKSNVRQRNEGHSRRWR